MNTASSEEVSAARFEIDYIQPRSRIIHPKAQARLTDKVSGSDGLIQSLELLNATLHFGLKNQSQLVIVR